MVWAGESRLAHTQSKNPPNPEAQLNRLLLAAFDKFGKETKGWVNAKDGTI